MVVGGAGVLRRDAVARPGRLRLGVRRRGHGCAGRAAVGRNPLRPRVDEVAPRHDRAAATADRDPWARDARGDPARGRARGRVGRDGSRGRRPGVDARLRRRLARRDHASPSRGARGGRAGRRSSRESRRRLGNLAARPRWPGEPRAGACGLPRGARTCGRGRDDGRRGAGRAVVSGYVGGASIAAAPCAVCAARSRCRAPRRRRLRDEHDPASRHRRPSRAEAARREARVRRGLRARDAQRPLRRDARRVPARRRRRSAALPPRDAKRGAEGSATRLLPELVPPRCRAALGARRRARDGSAQSRTRDPGDADARRASCRARARRRRPRVRRTARPAEGGRRPARGARDASPTCRS